MEYLFFLAFRNIVIRNKIFSNFSNSGDENFKLGYYKYSNIIETSWMINNGYYELCKEKVQRKEYLVFCTSRHLINHQVNAMTRDPVREKYDNGRKIAIYNQSIFNKQISNVAQWNSSNFYYYLFKNYSNYFIDNGNWKETEYYLIEYDNQEALSSLYISHCNTSSNPYKFAFETFHRSVEIGSFECAYFIYQKLGLLNNKEQLKSLVKSGCYFKLWNMVLVQNESELSSIGFGVLLNGRIEFLIDKCKLPLPPIKKLQTTTTIGYIFDFLIYNQTLSTLIQSVKTIVWLKDLLHNHLKEVNKKSFKFDKSDLSIEDLKSINIDQLSGGTVFDITITISEIESLKFNGQQLNTLVSDFNFIEHPIIFKLFKLVLPFTFQKSYYFLDNYLFLKLKSQLYSSCNSTITNNNNKIKSTLSINSSLFGIYNFDELLESKSTTGKLTIFHYCKNERREIQINYIKSFIKDITLSTYSNNIQKLINNIFIDLVKLDDIELINLLFSSKISIKFENEAFSIGLVYISINSIEMFDFVMDNLSKIIVPSDNTTTTTSTSTTPRSKFSLLYTLIVNSKPANLLEHYKSNYNQLYRNEVGYIEISIEEYILIEIGTIKFIYDNLDGFNYQSVNIWKASSRFIFKSISDYIYIVNRTPSDISYFCSWYNDSNYNYVLNHRPYDIESNRCNNNRGSVFYQYVKYKRMGNFEKLFKMCYSRIDSLIPCIECEVGKYGNCNFVDMLIQAFPTDQMYHYEMMFYLVKAVTNFGQITVFKHLLLNHSIVLNQLFEHGYNVNLNRNYKIFSCVQSGNLDLLLEIIKTINCFKSISSSNYYDLFVNSGTKSSDNHLLLNYFKNYNKK